MKERTKQILRYVACGLGGLALGIGLLGGLSMCATSSKKTTESVNTILTANRTRRNANPNGTFTITGMNYAPANWDQVRLGTAYTLTYSVNSEGEWHRDTSNSNFDITTFEAWGDYVNAQYESARSATANDLRFIQCICKINIGNIRYFYQYFSFVIPSGASYLIDTTPRILTNKQVNTYPNRFDADMSIGSNYSAYIVATGKCPYFLYSSVDYPLNNAVFEGVDTYYYNQGHSAGYNDGYSEGYEDGDQEGYDNGYQDGNEHGQAQGYEDGYDDGYASGFTDGADNSLLFTKIGANQTAWSLSDISWDVQGDTYALMKCFDFKDGDNNTYYVELNDYTIGGGEVQVDVYKNGTSSNNFYATIGRGDYNRAYTEIDIIPSSYLEFDFAQVITYYHNAIPNNWFMLTGTPANANGYQQGYQAGYRDGQMSTPSGQATDNVFALFTQAFNSVGGIFEMKIFGFLPLYWFFLTPIFIAIITLLLRMVKH